MPWKLTADAQDNWINDKYDRPRGFFSQLIFNRLYMKGCKKERDDRARERAREKAKSKSGIGMVSLRCHDCQRRLQLQKNRLDAIIEVYSVHLD